MHAWRRVWKLNKEQRKMYREINKGKIKGKQNIVMKLIKIKLKNKERNIKKTINTNL
jgi:hypothetical protein